MNKFIVLEGCDGTGKSSTALLIAKAINGVYYKTPPPIFKPLSAVIEETKNYDLRFYHYLAGVLYSSLEIKKLLKSTNVVCDRYIYTTIAAHRALGIDVPDNLERLVITPDYSFCLFARADEIKKRMSERKTLGYFDDDDDHQTKVRREFQKFPLIFIDNSDMTAEESVEKILQIIRL